MKKYKHIISLGFFCSVALELERINLRDCSSPFDWVISNFQAVLELINNNFDGFICLEYMQQYCNNPSFYFNKKYDIHFYHDFDKYKKCEYQIEKINAKYRRRIERFYKNIQEPTLFVRYIKDQKECNYIESNFDEILANLRNYNIENNIIFISNDNIISSNLKIFKVNVDKGDSVARKFLEKNSELKKYLCSDLYDKQKRITNYRTYKTKEKKKKLIKYPRKCIRGIKKIFLKPKIYDSLYQPLS